MQKHFIPLLWTVEWNKHDNFHLVYGGQTHGAHFCISPYSCKLPTSCCFFCVVLLLFHVVEFFVCLGFLMPFPLTFFITPSFPIPILRAYLGVVCFVSIQFFSTILLSQLQSTFSLPRLHETLCIPPYFPQLGCISWEAAGQERKHWSFLHMLLYHLPPWLTTWSIPFKQLPTAAQRGWEGASSCSFFSNLGPAAQFCYYWD